MRFHKLVQSFDYVSYPSLVELKSINKKMGDSLFSLGNTLFSTVSGIIFDITPGSEYIIDNYLLTSKSKVINAFAGYEAADKIIAIVLAAGLYVFLQLIRYIAVRFKSNKDTVDKRKEIASRFYRVIIPRLVSAKSIYEKSSGLASDPDKQFLLLLQVKYELLEWMHLVSQLKIVEVNNIKRLAKKKRDSNLTHKSEDVLEQIGVDAYFAVLADFLNTLELVYSDFRKLDSEIVRNILNSLYSELLAAQAFTVLENLDLQNQVFLSLKDKYISAKRDLNLNHDISSVK